MTELDDKYNELLKIRDILGKIDYKTLTDTLDSFLPRIPVNVWDFKNEKFGLNQLHTGGTNVVYRGRINQKDETPWERLSDISYIPEGKKNKITEFGRVNKPRESMFYCSADLHTACVETFSKGLNYERIKKEGKLHLTVGAWKIEKPLVLNWMTHSEKYFETFRGNLKGLTLKNHSIETVRANNSKIKELFDEKSFKILEFFSDEFAKVDIHKDTDYMLSNYYADRVFDRNPKFRMQGKIDGIVYPSVPTVYDYDNFVFPPEVVEDKLKFLWGFDMWVPYDSRTGNMSFIPIKQHIKIDSEGKFNWKQKLI